jgi:hypothetical protein
MDLIEAKNMTDMWISFKNGTKCLLRSGDDPERLRGPNLGWFWLDEAAMMPEMVFDIMIGRLRLDPGRAWITTTPKGKNWVWKVFVKERREDYSLIRCTSRDNQFLPGYYLDSLDRKYSGAFHQQEVEAEFIEWVDQPAYPSYRPKVNLVEGLREQYREDFPLALSCDFNKAIMCWPVGQILRGEPKVLTEVSIVGRADTRSMVKKFRREFPAHPGGVMIYGDSTGSGGDSKSVHSDYDQIMDEFRGYPSEVMLMVPRKNPPAKDRINAMNDALGGANGMWVLQMDAEETPILQEDLERVEMNALGTNVMKVTKPEDEKYLLTHASDALGYWVHMEWPSVGIAKERQKEHLAQFEGQVGEYKVQVQQPAKARAERQVAQLLEGL